MAVPKKKASKARTRRRFASYVTRKRNQILGRTHMTVCACGAMRLMHHVCAACGMYDGRQVLNVTKAEKKVTKIEA